MTTAQARKLLINAARELNNAENGLMSAARGMNESGYRTASERETMSLHQNDKQIAWNKWFEAKSQASDAGVRDKTVREIAEIYCPALPGLKNC